MDPEPSPRPQLPPRPPRPPRVRARPRPRTVPAPTSAWGWIEWTIVAQIVLPGVLYVPGLSVVRTPLRVASYLVPLAAWLFCVRSGAPRPAADDFPARPWVIGTMVWLALSVLHPNSNSLIAALASSAFYISILAPALWSFLVVRSSRQVPRMLAVFFLCNALSTVLGIAQIFRPDTFNPPYMPASTDPYFERFTFETDDGRKILRPCGLTDTPGGACSAGMVAALLGLCWALRPIAPWKRLSALGLAFFGVAVIYFSHTRVALVMLAICLAALTGTFVLQRAYRQAALLAAGGATILVGAMTWVVSTAGSGVWKRFATLFDSDPASIYSKNRGMFVQEAFERILWENPLGYGMGWWGMINVYFGRKDILSPIWVEVMWPAWIYDGGFPLVIAYVGGLVVALVDSLRIALTTKDRELAFWGAVIFASNLGIFATSFSFVTYLTPFGVQFWLQAAVLHAAERQSRAAASY